MLRRYPARRPAMPQAGRDLERMAAGQSGRS
jgi:hypothetical protein